MGSTLGDWLLVLAVIALAVATYWVIGRFIDNTLDYWRNRHEYDPDREQPHQVADEEARVYEMREHRRASEGDQREAARRVRNARARRR